jgi:hypothetical protein
VITIEGLKKTIDCIKDAEGVSAKDVTIYFRGKYMNIQEIMEDEE